MSEIKYEIIKKIGVFSGFAMDIVHYGKVVVSPPETIRLMAEVDGVIDVHGGWPVK